MSAEFYPRSAARMRALYGKGNQYKTFGKGETPPPEIDPDELVEELAQLRPSAKLQGLGRVATGREVVLVECLRGTVCNRVDVPFYLNRRSVNEIADIVERDARGIAHAAVRTADELLKRRAARARKAGRGQVFASVSRTEMTGLVLASEVYRHEAINEGPRALPGERFERVNNVAGMLRLAAEARLDEAERDKLLPNLMLLALAQQGFNFSLRQWSQGLGERDVNISPLVLKNVMRILGAEEGVDREVANGLLALTRPVYPNRNGEMVPGDYFDFIRRGTGRREFEKRGAGVEEGSHYSLLCLMANTAFDLMSGRSDQSPGELSGAQTLILSTAEEYQDEGLRLMAHTINFIDSQTIHDRTRRLPRLPLSSAREIFGQQLAEERSKSS